MNQKSSIRAEMQAIFKQAKPLAYAIFYSILLEVLNYFLLTSVFGISSEVKIESPAVRSMEQSRATDLLQTYSLPYSPTGQLSDYQYVVFVTLALWFICVFTGLCLELYFGTLIVQHFETHESMHWLYVYSNFLFPILTTVSCMAHSYLSIFPFVFGLFKFGFPEINAYLYRASSQKLFSIGWCADTLNGWGTLIHHSSALMCYMVLLTNLISWERYLFVALLIVEFQHVVAILRFIRFRTYVILTLLLEAWFEVEVISILSLAGEKDILFQLACLSMLESHWMYLLAGILEKLPHDHGEKEERKNNPTSFKNAAINPDKVAE